MNFDGFVTAAVVAELQATLAGGRIEKIYQPEPDELVFHIHNGKNKRRLYLSVSGSHARIHLLAEGEADNPQNPFAFCMLLRKHLQGGRIAGIRQVGTERIVEIDVTHPDELGYAVDRRLIVELMGKHSNATVVDTATGTILDSIKRIGLDVSRVRQLLPGMVYTPPPSQGKISFLEMDEAAFAACFDRMPGARPDQVLLASVQGVGPVVAAEIAERAATPAGGVPIAPPAGVGLKAPAPAAVWPAFAALVSAVRDGRLQPTVYTESDGTPRAFHVVPLLQYEGACAAELFDSPSRAVEVYFSRRAASNRSRQKATDLHRTVSAALDKLLLKKQRLAEDLLAAEDGDLYRRQGELLTAALHTVRAGGTTAEVPDYYTGGTATIPLDPRLTPSQNAQRYFRKYTKSKTAIGEKTRMIAETDATAIYLESVLAFLDQAGTPEEIDAIRQELVEGGYLRRRKAAGKAAAARLKPQSYHTSDGFRLLVGRNNRENDFITFKTADKRDIWFHTKDIPGSHVILVTEGKEPSETAIREAAAIAAFYSKARQSANVPVDYTRVRYVKKPAGAKPGMVIFTDNRTVYADPRLPMEGPVTGRPRANDHSAPGKVEK